MQSFKVWLEAINVPPYMPHIWWKETLEKAKYYESQFRSMKDLAQRCRQLEREYGLDSPEEVYSDLPYDFKDAVEDGHSWKLLSRAMEDYTSYYSKADGRHQSLLTKNLDPMTSWGWDFKRFIESYSDYFRRQKRGYNLFQDSLENLETDEQRQLFLDLKQRLDYVMEYIKLMKSSGRYVKAIQDRQAIQYASWGWGNEGEKKTMPEHKPVEILYHATSHTHEILATGFKTQSELGRAGLGGSTAADNDFNLEGICFTADFNIAKAIAIALKDVINIANGKMTLGDVMKLIRGEKISKDNYKSWITDQRYAQAMKNEINQAERAFELYTHYLTHSQVRYNPLFFGAKIRNFQGLDPNNVGVLACQCDMSKVIKYLSSMEEFRVTKDGILKIVRNIKV